MPNGSDEMQETEERERMLVYVLDMRGNPLMPCKPAKARHLLEAGRAAVARRTPFTIRLLFEVDGSVDDVVLGVDAGYRFVGLSAVSGGRELYAAEVELRNDIVGKLATRRGARRSRRSRLRHRKPRFDNRKRPEGWLAPSVEHKVGCHVKAVRDACALLPVSKVVVEVAQFDIQKLKDPSVVGVGYQHGEMEGWNAREYVLWRDGHRCAICGGRSGDAVLQVHHIESRKTGGDAPNNLVTLCRTCHGLLHAGKAELPLRRGRSYRDATFMNVARWVVYGRLKDAFGNVEPTYGYVTKRERVAHGLAKSHAIDARCIAGGAACEPAGRLLRMRKVRRNNRQVNKGNKLKGGRWKRNQAASYVHGFQLFDKVAYDGKEYFVFGRRSSGYFSIRDLDGNGFASVSCKKLELVEHAMGMLTKFEGREPQFLPTPTVALQP